MNKSEFYKKLIDVHKKTGQGLSGIIRAGGSTASLYGTYLDELLEEGLVVKCETGVSIGHPESNYFYMPSIGYNVWLDNPKNNKYKGEFLNYVRFYLKTNDSNDFSNDPNYFQWLEKNNSELEIMINISDVYNGSDNLFKEDEKEFIKKTESYKNNTNILEYISLCKKENENNLKIININKELLNLYNYDTLKYSYEIETAKNDNENYHNYIKIRKNILDKLSILDDKNVLIQDIV